MNLQNKILISVSLIALLFGSAFHFYSQALAQTATTTSSTAQKQAALQAQLDAINAQIAAQQQVLLSAQQQEGTLNGDINILSAKIAQAQLKIQAYQIGIEQLGKDINTKTSVIGSLDDQIASGKDSLAAIIKSTNELDSYSLAEILISNKDLSSFFEQLDSYDSIKRSMGELFAQIQSDKQLNETQRQSLNDQQSQEMDAEQNIQTQQANIKSDKAQQQKLLSLNKQQQSDYKSVIASKQAQAAQIRSALFSLLDSSSAIDFGTALQYANAAYKDTGVPQAFLLAILTQETNLGANIGSCYLTGADGNGVKIKTGAVVSGVMKADRDVPPFLALMTQLGRDPYHTPISCPLNVGYGGGMGPSQFIPSTWALLQPQITAATGKATPDPFNPQDAFTASAVYLSNLGASAATYTAERNAACKYYSGRSCTTESFNGFYGDDVMKIAASLQTNIDLLNGN